MRRVATRATQWAVLLLFLVVVDACVYRDPSIELGSGYTLSAISPGSEVVLSYSSKRDPRPYSRWFATDDRIIPSNRKPLSGQPLSLFNPETGARESYSSREEWRRQIKERRAVPPRVRLSGVTGLRHCGSLVYGSTVDGFFILRIDDNDLQFWDTREAWECQVIQLLGKKPEKLRSPRSRLMQSRSPLYIVCVVVLLSTCVGIQFLEIGLLRWRQWSRQ